MLSFIRISVAMVFHYNKMKLINIEVGTREQGIVTRGLTILLVVGMQILGFEIMKTVEHIKQGLMNHSSGSMGDRAEEHNLNCGDMAKDVQKRKILVSGLKTVFMMFQQRKQLLFALVQFI